MSMLKANKQDGADKLFLALCCILEAPSNFILKLGLGDHVVMLL